MYQYHRDTQDWLWKESQEDGTNLYKLERPIVEMPEQHQEIALLLSVSNSVKQEEVEKTLGHKPIIYELKAIEPGFDFLRSRKHLAAFGQEVRRVFEELRAKYDHHYTIHLFAALPAPAAIELGRNIKKDYPAIQLYEYKRENRGHLPVLKINKRI